MVHSKMEFVVDWGDNPTGSPEILKQNISQMNGVKEVDLKDGAVVIVADIPSSVLIKTIEDLSGRRTVLQGYGESNSAVAMISSDLCGSLSKVIGVVRLQETSEGTVVDATLDGLEDGKYSLNVHESGDLSEGCATLGDRIPNYGDLGVFQSNNDRVDFRNVVKGLELSNVIGRGMSVSYSAEDLRNPDSVVACGVIARSAGMFQNAKRICLCDGINVWDERNRDQIMKSKKPCCAKHKM